MPGRIGKLDSKVAVSGQEGYPLPYSEFSFSTFQAERKWLRLMLETNQLRRSGT
jgi:hypothetical protein